jgi:isochorismate synthase
MMFPPSVNLEKLVTELHPTPAVGGMPIIEGIECILENEGYDRTYYSGIIGEMMTVVMHNCMLT